MGGPEMAPHTPQPLVAPRRSRGAPRPPHTRGATAKPWHPSIPDSRLAIRLGRLLHRLPEDGVVAGENFPAGEAGDGLELLDRVQRPRRVPDHPGHALLVDVLLPIARVARQDHGPARV